MFYLCLEVGPELIWEENEHGVQQNWCLYHMYFKKLWQKKNYFPYLIIYDFLI